MVSKKLALSALCAAMVSQSAFAAEGHAINYNFLSGGLAVDSNGLAHDCKKSLEKGLESSGSPQPAKDVFKIKLSSVGGYLTGSYGFDNNVFLEGRLRTLANRKTSFFAGAGYHFPVDDRSDIYLLAGVSQPVLPSNIHLTQKGRDVFQGITKKEDNLNKAIVSFKSKLAPSLEVGYRANLCDEMGVRLAYRLTKDKIEMKLFEGLISEKSKGLSHELSAGAHYHFTPKLAAEVGYTFTKLPKFGGTKTKDSHMGTVGLRYAFN